MKLFTKFTPYLLAACTSLFCVSVAAQVTVSQQPSGVPLFTKMKEYRFPSGVCTQQQSAGLPDMVTYVTTTAKLVAIPEIEKCLKGLAMARWTVMQFDPPGVVNTLREARTDNMACAQIGVVQSPIMYMVKFSSYAHTNKQDELEQCLLGIHQAIELVPKQVGMQMNQHL